MAIDENGVYIPDSFETIRDEVQAKQILLGTNIDVVNSAEIQAMQNSTITAMYNLQSELAELPAGVSNDLSMQEVYIERANVNTSDAITNSAKESELIDYAEIFNKSSLPVAQIELYIYKDDIIFDDVDLQETANEIANISPPFVPYFKSEDVTLTKTYTCAVSVVSNIDVIFNIADAVLVTVDIITNPLIGEAGNQLKVDFTELFNTKQTIGKSFDEAFYQRTLFIDGLSSMNYQITYPITDPQITDIEYYEILRLGTVTVNGV